MKAKSFQLILLGTLWIIAVAWLFEAMTRGRGFVSTYLAPVVIVGNLGNILYVAVHHRWLPRPRFSLRTLLIAVMLIGSVATLWSDREPWVIDWTATDHRERSRLSDF